jgi:Ca2+/Na+ antiporter
MGIISNGFLAGLIWGTIFIGKPFTLQYARAELPKERWDDPALVRSCRFMAIVWALLLTFLALTACLKNLNPTLWPDRVNFDVTLAVIAGGIVFTSLYKKYKRNQHNSAV